MTSLLRIGSVVGVIVLYAMANAPAMAQEKCPALADVEWWTNTVPEVRRAVAVSFNGSWGAYIARWKKQKHDLQTAYDNGQAVEIKSRALVFRNDDLKDYIALVDERISTLECLKREYDDVNAVANFSTAAGTSTGANTPRGDQVVAAVEGQSLNLEVAAACQGKEARFQVTNLGDRWPRLAEVTIFRTDTSGKVTFRKLRMANSQQMTFNVPDSAGDIGEVGIFVAPSWYERKFSYDAVIKC